MVGGAVVWVVTGRVVAGRVVAGFLVVVVARGSVVVVVPARPPPEIPPKAPVPEVAAVVVVERLGPVVEGASEEAGATVGMGENTVPKASQPGPQRPWEARAKATVKATRAKIENPATRTRRRACQPWVRVMSSRWTRSIRSSCPGGAAGARRTGACLAAALRSTAPAPAGGTGVPSRPHPGRRRPPAVRRAGIEGPAGVPNRRGRRRCRAAGDGKGRAQLLGGERAGQQGGGVVEVQPAALVPLGHEHDHRSEEAPADLPEGVGAVLDGQVEHDHVGAVDGPALGQLAQRADAAEPVGGVQEMVEHRGQAGALGQQHHPPPVELARPAPPATRLRHAHLPAASLEDTPAHAGWRHGAATSSPFQAFPASRRYGRRNRKLDYDGGTAPGSPGGGAASQRSTSAVCSPRAGGASR